GWPSARCPPRGAIPARARPCRSRSSSRIRNAAPDPRFETALSVGTCCGPRVARERALFLLFRPRLLLQPATARFVGDAVEYSRFPLGRRRIESAGYVDALNPPATSMH